MTNDETGKINVGVKVHFSWGLRKYSHKKQSIKGTRKINYLAVVPVLSGTGSRESMNNRELKIFTNPFWNYLTIVICDSWWECSLVCNFSCGGNLLFISPTGILFHFHELCGISVKAFLICRNSQEKLVTQTAGVWAAARAGEQRALPMFCWWFWWQVFGIVGCSLEPRDHGQTSLFLFLWFVGFFNNFMLPFLIEQSCCAFVVGPFLDFPEYDITGPDLSKCLQGWELHYLP